MKKEDKEAKEPVTEVDVRGMQLQLRTCIKSRGQLTEVSDMNPVQCVLRLTDTARSKETKEAERPKPTVVEKDQ